MVPQIKAHVFNIKYGVAMESQGNCSLHFLIPDEVEYCYDQRPIHTGPKSQVPTWRQSPNL